MDSATLARSLSGRAETVRDRQLKCELTRRAVRNVHEAQEVSVTVPAGTFRDVAPHRDGRPAHLIHEPIAFGCRE